jgi:ElaB/YqjD/DUF883 family membrane-anchored ribosome-binding protein
MNRTNSAIEKVEDAIASTGAELRNRAQSAANSAHDAASTAIDNVARTASDVRDSVRPAADRLAARGSEIAHDAWAATREAGQHVRKSTGKAVRQAENYVSEQPLRSVAIAFAAGAAVTALILAARSRRSSSYR